MLHMYYVILCYQPSKLHDLAGLGAVPHPRGLRMHEPGSPYKVNQHCSTIQSYYLSPRLFEVSYIAAVMSTPSRPRMLHVASVGGGPPAASSAGQVS